MAAKRYCWPQLPFRTRQHKQRLASSSKERNGCNTVQTQYNNLKNVSNNNNIPPINPLTLSTGLSRVRVVGGVYAVCVRNKYGAVKISSLTTSSTASPHTNFGSALLPLSSDQHLLCHLFIIQTRRSTYRTASTGNNVSEGLCWKTPAG